MTAFGKTKTANLLLTQEQYNNLQFCPKRNRKKFKKKKIGLDYCSSRLHVFLHCGIFYISNVHFLMFKLFTPVRFVLPC